jgi:hypothetical protein
MTLIESSGFLVSLSFAFLSIFSIGSFMVRDFQLLLRKGIRYQNYSKKEPFFRLKPTTFHLNAYRILVVLGIIVSLFYIFTNMVRIYLVILLPLTLLMVFFYFQELKIQDTNISLHKFDRYYEEIHTLIEKKASLLENIQQLNEMLSEKHKGFYSQIELINPMLKDTLDRSYYLKLTTPIKLKIDGYQQDLTRFDNSLSKKFNDLLKTYLKTLKITKGLEVPELISFSPKAIEEDINRTELQLTEQVLLDAEEWLLANMANPESPVQLLRFLERYQTDLDTHQKLAFSYYHNASERSYWFNYLEEKKLYQIQFLGKHNYLKEYPWIFQSKLYQNLKTDQALEIMQTLLKQDYYDTTLTMLLTLPLTFRDLLPRVTSQEQINNRTSKLLSIFIDVFAKPLEFYHPTTILFDQAMAIQHYFGFEYKDSSFLDRINSIVNERRIEAQKELILNSYQDIFIKLTPAKNKAIQMLILLQDVVGADHPWFNFSSLVVLIHEYHKTFQAEKLNLLLVLIFLMISLQTQSDKIFDKAFKMVQSEVDNLIKIPNKTIAPDVVLSRVREALKRDGYYQNLAAIVSRIEQKRQVLDQILESTVA